MPLRTQPEAESPAIDPGGRRWAFTSRASSSEASRRNGQEAIFLGLPDALDLMVVCVEAGLGLDTAMRRVTTELAESCPVLCEEFAIANFQVQMGRPRRTCSATWDPHRRRRRPGLGGRDHPGRKVRIEHRHGPARPVRLDAAQAPAAGRGTRGEDGGEDQIRPSSCSSSPASSSSWSAPPAFRSLKCLNQHNNNYLGLVTDRLDASEAYRAQTASDHGR